MPREFKIGLNPGDIIEVTTDDHIIIRDKDIICTIKKTYWILPGFSTLKAGKYKVTERGTLVPYKPLPELKSGDLCKICVKKGASIYDTVGFFLIKNGSVYSFSYTNTQSFDLYLHENEIQSIVVIDEEVRGVCIAPE